MTECDRSAARSVSGLRDAIALRAARYTRVNGSIVPRRSVAGSIPGRLIDRVDQILLTGHRISGSPAHYGGYHAATGPKGLPAGQGKNKPETGLTLDFYPVYIAY